MSFNPQERNEKLNLALRKWQQALEENEAVIEDLKRRMNKKIEKIS